MKNLILGVDGGNSKTDYFLFDTEGNFIGSFRGPTCSHEQFRDSYQGSYQELKRVFDEFLPKYNVKPKDLIASVFGLAGVDTPKQKANIEGIIKQLGFENFIVVNDSFLGVKAATSLGYGVCSINGTGTSSGGIDRKGNYLQVGGIGGIVGDEAGGSYIARMAIRACYDAAYRFGKPTSLSKIVMDMLGVTDKYYLMEAISDALLSRKIDYTALTLSVFREEKQNDQVSMNILKQVGENCARSVGGAIVNLDFPDEVEVVLAGSVWVKGASEAMLDSFQKTITELTKKKCKIIMLNVPPATGAVIWALEAANGYYPDKEMRELIIKNVEEQLYRMDGTAC